MDLDISEFLSDIEAAIQADGNIWEHEQLAGFKNRIKEYYRGKLNEQCCYCRKNTTGEFNMVLDIEHILPKSKFRHYMFHTYNLTVSCKRCNMNIKREDISFVINPDEAKIDGNRSDLYKFIHPNLDDYFDHLEYYTKTQNQHKIIKYKVIANSSKGQFTYDYFKLAELEIDTINGAQGLKKGEELSENIDPEIAVRIENLLKKGK